MSVKPSPKRSGVRRKNTELRHDLLELAMADTLLSSTSKCVLAVLLFKFANGETGLCNPSFKAIATAIGHKRRAVVPAVAKLRERGWISYESTLGGSEKNTNRFTFAFERLTGAAYDTPTGAENDTPTGAVNVARGAEDCPRTTEEPPGVSRGGSSNPFARGGARPGGRAPAQRKWGSQPTDWDALAREYAGGSK